VKGLMKSKLVNPMRGGGGEGMTCSTTGNHHQQKLKRRRGDKVSTVIKKEQEAPCVQRSVIKDKTSPFQSLKQGGNRGGREIKEKKGRFELEMTSALKASDAVARGGEVRHCGKRAERHRRRKQRTIKRGERKTNRRGKTPFQ